jgi:ComF family protein
MFDYQDIRIKDIIWKLKYHHKHYLGEKLGQLLYEFFIEDISDIKTHVTGRAILVIPVPISNNKIKSRGYNQANAIARGFCDMANNDILLFKKNIIIKRIDTIPQAKITNRKRRLENVRGVFEIKNPEIVKGRTIVVIDDVTTTGGTISEIIKILKKAGAKKVVGFAVAH